MESNMSERLIGVKPETAIQSFTASLSVREQLSITWLNLKTFRVAVFSVRAALQFFNGIDGLALDSLDKEQTERREEVNNLPSKSEPSASDSDRHGARVIPPSNHPIDDTNGSALNRSPWHSNGSHDNNSFDQTHQAPGHDDSNPSRSILVSGGYDHAVTSNNVPGLVDPNDSNMEQGLLSVDIEANTVTDRSRHATGVTTSFWIFSATGFGFEAVSAFFDQVSSPQKPHYALYGMLLSVLAIPVCILDLIRNAKTSGSDMLWGILPEVFGLALACVQCISSALQFSFICRHAANPVKVSLVPFLFFFALFAFKYRNGRN